MTTLCLIYVLVITIYSKTGGRNSPHEWVSSLASIGEASYVYVQVYGFYPALGTAVLSSMSCPSLNCTTFLRIPPTHIIVSMASFTGIQRQNITSASSAIRLIALCEGSGRLFAIIKDREKVFAGVITELCTLMRQRAEGQAVIAPSGPVALSTSEAAMVSVLRNCEMIVEDLSDEQGDGDFAEDL